MRPICDVCEAAPARVFCAADEAALCPKCDEKVHGCNKLASRHIRLTLAEASVIRRCDICENAPAFFFCGIDGTSLCLQCDMDVHVGGKRTHERYLLMGQRVELPISQVEGKKPVVGMKITEGDDPYMKIQTNHENPNRNHPQERKENSSTSAIAIAIGNTASQMIDLNFRPYYETSSASQRVRNIELANSEAEGVPAVVPDVSMTKEAADS